MEDSQKGKLLPVLQHTVQKLADQYSDIPEERKALLQPLTTYIAQKTNTGQSVALNFICTHNSRRSHIAQLWAQAAAHYYSIANVSAFSGGTEATAFNPRAVKAMQAAGFEISQGTSGENPEYNVRFSTAAPTVKTFSKKYNDPFNPASDFAAVMTCSHADENCPLITGASKRISTPYNDPKDFDNTPLEEEKYNERVMEIGREILYAFSQVK